MKKFTRFVALMIVAVMVIALAGCASDPKTENNTVVVEQPTAAPTAVPTAEPVVEPTEAPVVVETTEAVEEVVEEATETVEAVVEETTEAVEEVAEEATETVEAVVEETTEAVEEVVEEATETVEAVVEETTEAVEEVVEEATETVEAVVEETTEAVEEVAEEATETVEAVVEETTEAVEEVVEEATETVEAVVEETTEAVEEVAEEATETVEAVVEETTEAVEEVIEAVAPVTTYADYAAAPVDTPVEVETYVQAKQSWWDNKGTFYTQNEDGAYFIYEMAISEEDYNKLVPGTKILVKGYKGEWAGEVEIVDATFEILEGNYVAEAKDLTNVLGTDELINYQNQFAAFNGLTVEAISYKNGEPGDDIYVTLSLNGASYDFCVERYLTGPETEVYTAFATLHTGDVVDVEGFVYWYNGVNTHITKVTVVACAEEAVVEEAVVEEVAAEEAVVEEAVVEEVAAEEAVVEEAVTEEPAAEEVVTEEVAAEEAVVEEPVAEEAVVEEVAAEEAVVEEAVTEEVAAEEAVVEEPVAEEAVVEEAVTEEPAAEEAVTEEVAAEEAVVEEPVAEEAVVEEPVAEEVVEDIAVMTYAEYVAAEMDSLVKVETYVQAKQSWWDNKATFYTQNEDGAYFIYEMAISEEDYNKLVPGTKILVKGYKGEWAGEVEIVDATFEILEGNFIAEPLTVTSLLGNEKLIDYQNQLVSFKSVTIEKVEYKNGEPGDDIYVTISYEGNTYDFCVERYLTAPETEVYQTVGALHVGDVVDIDGFLYWYNGVNTHITGVTVVACAEEAPAEEVAETVVETEEVAAPSDAE